MSTTIDVTPAILYCEFVAQLYRATQSPYVASAANHIQPWFHVKIKLDGCIV